MATIKDVAREAGLSVTTVSRALNNYDDVAAATRARVQEVAQSLDYHPNAAARSLQRSYTNTIGLVIPLVLHRSYDTFWLDFIGGVAAACAVRGVDLLVSATETRDDLSPGFYRLVRGNRVDGILICDIRGKDGRIAYLQRQQLPFVAFGRTVEDHSYPFVDIDGTAGVRQAMDHFIGLGHRRIAYLGVDPDFGFSHFRLLGYREGHDHAGLRYDPALVHQGLTEDTVATAVSSLLALPQPPTALFAAGDFLAVAALKAIRALGRTVPGDLSVAVFDDSPLVQHADPPLTAVRQPNRRVGEEAGALLLDRVTNPALPCVQRLVVPTLIVRNSTIYPAADSRDAAV